MRYGKIKNLLCVLHLRNKGKRMKQILIWKNQPEERQIGPLVSFLVDDVCIVTAALK